MKGVSLSKAIVCLASAVLAALLAPQTVFAQEAGKPVVNIGATRERIAQFGVVVKDVSKVAKRYSEVFGTSWKFYDFKPVGIILHGRDLGDVECLMKVAIGDIGGRSFKLIQPVSGPSTYMEFLQKYGEGILYFSFGAVGDYGNIVDSLKKAGVGIEMQGHLGEKATFTILDTLEDLGCYVELNSPAWNDANMQLTDVYEHKASSLIDMTVKFFGQVGIVVNDEKKAAKRYQDLLGIGRWNFVTPRRTNVLFNEKPVSETEMSGARIDVAMAYLGDLQIELVKTVEGPNPQRKFLDRRGTGIQHLSIGHQPDYDQVVAASKKAGIKSEFSCKWPGFFVSHLAMQEQLGGWVLEILSEIRY
jgi:hypothetical protein